MVVFLVLAGAAYAGAYDDVDADVEVRRVIDASAEVIHDAIDDFEAYRAVLDDDCATQWELGEPIAGVGARATVRYTFGPLRRQLIAQITDDRPGTVWQLEHVGNRGWYTQIRYEQTDAGTEVVWLTPLEPPPWPFRGVFYKKVRPAMVDCYTRALANLEQRIAGS